ncbi:hypothetical protein M0812_05019 [Anaeramoeba flamelloides]|uniref:Integrator complex subunit 7 N-terminal domain-containing protein n=1 Tax=Anaeramoeba flamelloides TaxID=1746091 RepID=A0AAV8AAT3_9EUKA|nr:hypothetical protein M0812_05019 [Anaeramoeba flamelloides]
MDEIILKLEKGLRSSNTKERSDSILALLNLKNQPEIITRPNSLKTLFFKLANLFYNETNLIRYHVLQVFLSLREQFSGLPSFSEDLLKPIIGVLEMNDPIARTLSLKVFGSICALLKDRVQVHHLIMSSLQSRFSDERKASEWVNHQMARVSLVFCEGILEKLNEFLNNQSDLESRDILLFSSLLSHMKHSTTLSKRAFELGKMLLLKFPTFQFVQNILNSLTKCSLNSIVILPLIINLLSNYLFKDRRLNIKLISLRLLSILIIKHPQQINQKQATKLTIKLVKLIENNTDPQLLISSLNLLKKIIATTKINKNEKKILDSINNLLILAYSPNIEISVLSLNICARIFNFSSNLKNEKKIQTKEEKEKTKEKEIETEMGQDENENENENEDENEIEDFLTEAIISRIISNEINTKNQAKSIITTILIIIQKNQLIIKEHFQKNHGKGKQQQQEEEKLLEYQTFQNKLEKLIIRFSLALIESIKNIILKKTKKINKIEKENNTNSQFANQNSIEFIYINGLAEFVFDLPSLFHFENKCYKLLFELINIEQNEKLISYLFIPLLRSARWYSWFVYSQIESNKKKKENKNKTVNENEKEKQTETETEKEKDMDIEIETKIEKYQKEKKLCKFDKLPQIIKLNQIAFQFLKNKKYWVGYMIGQQLLIYGGSIGPYRIFSRLYNKIDHDHFSPWLKSLCILSKNGTNNQSNLLRSIQVLRTTSEKQQFLFQKKYLKLKSQLLSVAQTIKVASQLLNPRALQEGELKSLLHALNLARSVSLNSEKLNCFCLGLSHESNLRSVEAIQISSVLLLYLILYSKNFKNQNFNLNENQKNINQKFNRNLNRGEMIEGAKLKKFLQNKLNKNFIISFQNSGFRFKEIIQNSIQIKNVDHFLDCLKRAADFILHNDLSTMPNLFFTLKPIAALRITHYPASKLIINRDDFLLRINGVMKIQKRLLKNLSLIQISITILSKLSQPQKVRKIDKKVISDKMSFEVESLIKFNQKGNYSVQVKPSLIGKNKMKFFSGKKIIIPVLIK